MKKILFAVAPLALATACSGGGSDSLEAGEWAMTSQLTSVEIPGMPPEMTAAMTGDPTTNSRCISEEEAADPGANLFAPEDAAEDCDFAGSTVENGVINVAAECQLPNNSGTGTMSIDGTYTGTTMEAEFTFEGESAGTEMRMAGTMSAERTGDCEA